MYLTGVGDELTRRAEITLPNGQTVSLVLTLNDNGYALVSGSFAGASMSAATLDDMAKQLASASGLQVGYNQQSSSTNTTNEQPSLLDPDAETHVLDGDEEGGGHRSGTGNLGKSEFPNGWSDEKILGEISDVATDPNEIWFATVT
ncbi:hypothetical protein AB4Z52_16805 [Rhizobium sp. 2YAF20]|jgi:hypothetical protein|uniref:hypothetical protein n=1 Tax=Rhizobium sp. 2YAF20 TaxID=3233027 RepID=UPI003F9B5F03